MDHFNIRCIFEIIRVIYNGIIINGLVKNLVTVGSIISGGLVYIRPVGGSSNYACRAIVDGDTPDITLKSPFL